MFSYPSSPLLSERLFIRELRHSDLEDLLVVHSVDAVNRYLPYTTWKNSADAEAWWEKLQERMLDGNAMQFVICDRAQDKAIGGCILFGYAKEHQRAELGYAIGQSYWGKGYAREAMQRFLRYAFEDIGLRRIDAKVDSRNEASSGLLLRLGFTSEGCLRQWIKEEDSLIDMRLFGLLSHEWQITH
ncbi:MAG: GNAT family N-acetyltransferase [Halioglobus sp.]